MTQDTDDTAAERPSRLQSALRIGREFYYYLLLKVHRPFWRMEYVVTSYRLHVKSGGRELYEESLEWQRGDDDE